MQSRIVASWICRISRMKSWTSSFERGSRPVVGSSSRSRIGCVSSARGERDLLLHASRETFHRLASPVGREADPLEDARDLVARLVGRHPVEARRVREVLRRGHLLEERGLDRHAVDEPADSARLLEDVVAEDGRVPAVVQEQGREEPDQRRLARAVLAQDGDALAARDLEADAAQGLDALAAAAQAGALAVAAAELLAQVVDFYCGHVLLQTRLEGTRNWRARRCLRRRARKPDSTEAQHRAAQVSDEIGAAQASA